MAYPGLEAVLWGTAVERISVNQRYSQNQQLRKCEIRQWPNQILQILLARCLEQDWPY